MLLSDFYVHIQVLQLLEQEQCGTGLDYVQQELIKSLDQCCLLLHVISC